LNADGGGDAYPTLFIGTYEADAADHVRDEGLSVVGVNAATDKAMERGATINMIKRVVIMIANSGEEILLL